MYLVHVETGEIYTVKRESGINSLADKVFVKSIKTKLAYWLPNVLFRPLVIQYGDQYEYKKNHYRKMYEINCNNALKKYQALIYQIGPGYSDNEVIELSKLLEEIENID